MPNQKGLEKRSKVTWEWDKLVQVWAHSRQRSVWYSQFVHTSAIRQNLCCQVNQPYQSGSLRGSLPHINRKRDPQGLPTPKYCQALRMHSRCKKWLRTSLYGALYRWRPACLLTQTQETQGVIGQDLPQRTSQRTWLPPWEKYCSSRHQTREHFAIKSWRD